jgi:hypothetical protein
MVLHVTVYRLCIKIVVFWIVRLFVFLFYFDSRRFQQMGKYVVEWHEAGA